MKRKSLFGLVALLGTVWICPAFAGNKQLTDYAQAVEAAEKSDLDYKKFKTRLLRRYDPLINQLQEAEGLAQSAMSDESGVLPTNFQPWWQEIVSTGMETGRLALQTDLNTLFSYAVSDASQVKVFGDLRLIRKTNIQESEGVFDWNVFVEGRIQDLDEPVGNDLTTGGPLRYEETARNLEYGVRKKFITGTEIELKQNIGDLDTNSTHFDPEEQALSGTSLSITQPLLRRFGIDYNRSATDLANIDYSIAQDEFQRNMESHLLEVSRAYWGLYLERSLLAQRKRLAQRSSRLFEQMQSRAGMDVEPNLIARARSMVNAHKLAAMQAKYAVYNAQSRINALVNAPELLAGGPELITSEQPSNTVLSLSFEEVIRTTLDNRPEISQALKHIQSAAIRLANSNNELRPNLDLFFETYVKGLAGDFEYGTAYENQFNEGDPSYIGGLRLEYPLGNNAAEARNLRRKIELRQYVRQLDTAVQNVLLEAQVSYRELIKNYRSMVQSYEIMHSDAEEVEALMAKVDLMLSKKQAYGDVLYRLLDASERLTDSEKLYAESELAYNYAIYNLYRAMGVLVQKNGITTKEQEDKDGLPIIRIEKLRIQ